MKYSVKILGMRESYQVVAVSGTFRAAKFSDHCGIIQANVQMNLEVINLE